MDEAAKESSLPFKFIGPVTSQSNTHIHTVV
jgi:hypothetical protein